MTNDIIVFLPGIGGSRLEREGKLVYDLSLATLPSLIWNWVNDDLVYTGGSSKPDDGVVATNLFNNQLIPGFFGVDDYDGLCVSLKAAVSNPEQQFFEFPYDWRASNRWAAEALDVFIRPKLHDWCKGVGGNNAKLLLVCHSMGGLVARYFLEHLGGANITRHLITIGTPHRGAPKALNALVNGLGVGPLDFSKVIRSFASTYELLPQYPVIRIGKNASTPLARIADFFGITAGFPETNTSFVQTSPTDLIKLPNIDRVLLQNALEFHAAIRNPVIQRMHNDEKTPYEISCFFNQRQATPQSACWLDGSLVISDAPPVPTLADAETAYNRGDGTVPGVSAIPIEWPDTSKAISVDEKHVAMPSATAVKNIIYNYANPHNARQYMGCTSSICTIGLTLPPLVLAGEPFAVVVDVIKFAQLEITITSINSASFKCSRRTQVAERSSASVEFTLVKQGTYLVTAKSAANPLRPAVSDWVVVICPH